MPLVDHYTQQRNEHSRDLGAVQQKIFWISIMRLVTFAGAAISLYIFFRDGGALVAAIALLLILAFVLLIKWNFRLSDRKALLQKLIFVNSNELNVLDDLPNNFYDGETFLSDDSFGNDLDIFGDRSLFHLLNRTTTSHGTDSLANLLTTPMSAKAEIEEMQQAVHTLSRQTVTRQLLIAYGLLNSEQEGNLHQVTTWLSTRNELHQSALVKIVRWVMPVFNIAALLYYWSSDNYLPLAAGVATSWIFIGIYAKYIAKQHSLVGKKQAILDQYGSILKIIGKIEPGSSNVLARLQSNSANAYGSIRKLSQLSSLLDQRINMVVNIFLNSLLVYDLQCLYALENWKIRNKHSFNEWIRCVGEIEAINSLATLAFNNPGFCIPVVREGNLVIQATGISHPLIPANERIANDLGLGETCKLALITGSNMSGKTTFLRTVGINLLLAQCGAPVCAASFEFTPMLLLTAIRISDSLQLHTSYFMAELKRLQMIIRHLETGKPGLVLVDEILRGTNSDDKSHGSEEFIKKIISYHCLALFATHDLSLSAMEDHHKGIIGNYCFESLISDEELSFDYKLRAGVAKNKNASFLMKKMEII